MPRQFHEIMNLEDDVAWIAAIGEENYKNGRDQILVDLIATEKNEAIALVNTTKRVWTHKRGLKRSWTCKDVGTGTIVEGKVLPIETHGHVQVVSFGTGFSVGARLQVSNGFTEYDTRTLKRSVLHGMHFNLVASLFISYELEQVGVLERWVDWHQSIGVEHFLVYINREHDGNTIERLYKRFPTNVTFIPFWFGHDVPFGDQAAQNMHALYTSKGASKWMLSSDVDEYLFVPGGLENLFRQDKQPIAFQFASYKVDNDGHIARRPQYGTDLKGKVILNTELTTGHCVHMVTDAIGGKPWFKHTKKSPNHLNVPPDVGKIAHFQRTLRVLEQHYPYSADSPNTHSEFLNMMAQVRHKTVARHVESTSVKVAREVGRMEMNIFRQFGLGRQDLLCKYL